MDHSPWLRVPIGPDAARWRTFTPSRTALIVVRTQTTVSWLFDLLPELLGDPRIQVVFTVNGESSAFEPGVAKAVERLGGTLLPWGQAIDMPFDLAISASFRGGLDHLQAPVLVLPHGPGYTRLTGSPTADWLGSVRPACGRMATVALTHPAQRSQWWSQVESDHVNTAVVGDPCFDVLQTSIARVDRYRRALGVQPHQRLVVVSSTWGPGSLIGTRPSILEELVAELPVDTYVIAAVLHPNVWVGHGTWQLRTWLRASLDGGVRLIPHLSGWRATIVAADCLIGDHGSVTFYGACLGVPTMLGSFAAGELVPTTPLAVLGRRAPSLGAPGTLRRQLEAEGFTRNPARYADLVRRAFSNTGRAMDSLRALVYKLIDLPAPPHRPGIRSTPDPAPELRRPSAHRVITQLADNQGGRLRPELTVERFPSSCREPEIDGDVQFHLNVGLDELDPELVESASVIVCPPGMDDEPALPAPDLLARLRRVLDAYPGARVVIEATSAGNALVATRRGPDLLVTTQARGTDWVGPVGSAIYWLSIDHRGRGLPREFVVRLGGLDLTVVSTPLSSEDG